MISPLYFGRSQPIQVTRVSSSSQRDVRKGPLHK